MKNEEVYQWLDKGIISTDNADEALQVAGLRATASNWYQFLMQFLMLAGIVSLACGFIFFFAYNWSHMHHLVKLGIVQLLLFLAVLAYLRIDDKPYLSNAVMFGLVLLLGSLLALVGQIYQTGADPWQLFAIWSVLIIPLALISRSSMIWISWQLILNVGLILYFETRMGIFGFLFKQIEQTGMILLANTLILGLLEYLSYSNTKFGLKNRFAAQLAALLVIFTATLIGIWSIFDSGLNNGIYMLVYLLGLLAIYVQYRHRKHDLLILSAWTLSLIVFVTTLLIKAIGDFNAGIFLIIAMAIIGMSSAGAYWLKHTNQIFQKEAQS
ncbi:MAG: DUF2157 domain-containing protein [Proteobacteria bacterium]|nr:DUF2157 domain-containing protein [Pseudomonadota bacterium]